jgi:hypothetical protein
LAQVVLDRFQAQLYFTSASLTAPDRAIVPDGARLRRLVHLAVASTNRIYQWLARFDYQN